MVEKSKPTAAAERLESLPKRQGPGILKKSSTSLQPVPEFAESKIQRVDSNLETVESERTSTPHEEQQKFKTLCEGVQNCLALFQTSLSELLYIKDELLKHALPPSLLLKVALVTGKLFRSSSDLSVPITELVRMVKLYSTPWETKSAALKKLHEDYENKQRQLNVALQKLVLVGIQSQRLAQERKVLNWEKLFSKMMTSKAHGYRWKFLIESFKEKVKTGEVYVAGSSTDEEAEREKQKGDRALEFHRKRSMIKDTAAKRIMRESLAGKSGEKPQPSVFQDKDKGAISDDDPFSDVEITRITQRTPSPDLRHSRKLSPTRITISPEITNEESSRPVQSPTGVKPEPNKSSRPRIKFLGASDDEDSEKEEQLEQDKRSAVKPAEKTKRKPVFADEVFSRPKQAGVRFLQSDDEDEEEDEENEGKQPVKSVPLVVKMDKQCWTHEPEFDRYLHLRIYKPECKKAPAPFCSIAFRGELFKTDVFEEVELEEEPGTESVPMAPAAKMDSAKKSEKTKNEKQKPGRNTSEGNAGGKKNTLGGSRGKSSRGSSPVPSSRPTSAVLEEERKKPGLFNEVMLKLPDDNGCVLGESVEDLTHEPLRFAVHPAGDRQMIAMATVNYGELKIMDKADSISLHADIDALAQQFPLISVVSDRDMPFNSTCGQVSVVCYMSKIERMRKLEKNTETIPFVDLVSAAIEARKQEEEKDDAAEKTQETPELMYTEGDVKALKEQHAEEIQLLQEEYEKRLNELAQGLGPYPADLEASRGFIDASTSPLYVSSPLLHRSPSPEQGKTPRPPSEARPSPPRKPRARIPNLPEWGKDLPEDFLVRLHLFNENSSKYRQDLSEKTRRAIQERYELQMAVQNRLAHTDEEREEDIDVCLPAVFMPTRTSHVFSPKAHSYFHPPGSSEGRLTQAPSIFKLPAVAQEAQVSVLNLFEMSKKYSQTGPLKSVIDQARPHTIANPEQQLTNPPPPTACDVWSPPPYQSRARTR